MARHGVGDWSLGWDNARTRAGMCRYNTRTISLSRPLMALYEREQVREVVLHEIAHALVGAKHNHDAVWRAKAREIGSTGARALPVDSPRPPAPWVGQVVPPRQVNVMHAPAWVPPRWEPARPGATDFARCPRRGIDGAARRGAP